MRRCNEQFGIVVGAPVSSVTGDTLLPLRVLHSGCLCGSAVPVNVPADCNILLFAAVPVWPVASTVCGSAWLLRGASNAGLSDAPCNDEAATIPELPAGDGCSARAVALCCTGERVAADSLSTFSLPTANEPWGLLTSAQQHLPFY